MAALLVGLSIMAVMMTVAMPVWKQTAQREKEAELVFRGQQYARAIGLFQRKFANSFPPNLDVLVDQKFLRKKYKDPITGEDFLPLLQTQVTPGAGTAGAPTPGGKPGGAAAPPGSGAVAGAPRPGAGAAGGIVGVSSKSKDRSIRIYNGRGRYNEWAFVFVQQTQAPGVGGAPGAPGRPGQPGQPQRPGQPQNPIGPGGFRPGGGPNNPNPPQRPGLGPIGRPQGGFDPLFPQPSTQPRRPGG